VNRHKLARHAPRMVPDTFSGPLRENVLKCGVVRPLFEQFESAKLSEK